MNLVNINILVVTTFIDFTDNFMELRCSMFRIVVKLNIYSETHQDSLHALAVLGEKQGCQCKS